MTAAAASIAGLVPIPAIGPAWLNPQQMLESFGTWALLGICLVIIAETGLLVGFFLPGDSLLFTAGLLVSQNYIHQPIWVVAPVTALAALSGDQLGYLIGRRFGPRLFDRPDSRLFRRSFVDKTEQFYRQYGGQAVVLGRFIPIVRTFMPVTAGISRMHYGRFLRNDVVGAVAWGAGVTVLGFFLGQIAFIRDNVEVLLAVIVLISVTPPAIEVIRHRRKVGRGEDPGAEPAVAAPAAGREAAASDAAH